MTENPESVGDADDASRTIYTPGEAANLLGVTTQSLRRYAEDYKKVFEPVQTHAKQRVFDGVIVGRLRTAQGLQQQGVVASIRAGLERVRDGDAQPGDLKIPTANTPFEQAVLERLEAQESMLRQLHEENRALHGQLAEMRQLPPPARNEGRGGELEKLNAYLLGELERRRLEAEAAEKLRPWWRLWGRR